MEVRMKHAVVKQVDWNSYCRIVPFQSLLTRQPLVTDVIVGFIARLYACCVNTRYWVQCPTYRSQCQPYLCTKEDSGRRAADTSTSWIMESFHVWKSPLSRIMMTTYINENRTYSNTSSCREKSETHRRSSENSMMCCSPQITNQLRPKSHQTLIATLTVQCQWKRHFRNS